ncbi:Hypothetical predicted protein [Paramuricea clavata]|nr:Hypothetical predicted protein [Paramuricea clavata]
MTASRGDERTSVILVEHGANVLLVDDLGFTPVDVATGSNVQLFLKEAWTEHAQRSVDSGRVKSAPVAVPVKLDHLDAPDVTNLMKNDDESEKPLKKTSKKSSKKLQGRSHSEEQTQPQPSSGLPRRTRSYSSGPSPRSKLDPIHQDILQSDEGRISPLTQKTILGRTSSSEVNLRPNKTPQTEIVPRPTAKVAVLNIDLQGHDLHGRQKSKSCSELPFTRYRVQKLSNPRACSTAAEPLNNPLSLRGRSVSALSLSSFETLPGITPEAGDEVNDGVEIMVDPSAEPQIVITPPANGSDQPTDEQCPSSPETDILNKTFNSKEKPVFWFPNNTNVRSDTNSTPKFQNSDRGFFVDWKELEIPLQKCTKCREEFKPEDLKPGTSICNMCYRESIAKDTFWVPFGSDGRKSKSGMRTAGSDDRNTRTGTQTADERKIQTGTRSSSVDDRTVCIDKETLNILRKKKLSEGCLDSEHFSQNSKERLSKTKQVLKKTLSDTSQNRNSFDCVKSSSKNREEADSVANEQESTRNSLEVNTQVQIGNDTVETNSFCGEGHKSGLMAAGSSQEIEQRRVISQNNSEKTTEAGTIQYDKTDSVSVDVDSDPEELTENSTICSSPSVNEEISKESDLKQREDTLEGTHNANKPTANTPSSKFIIKEFTKCRQTLERLRTDMMCLEKNEISADVIRRLSSQSAAEKGGKQQPATLTTKSKPVVQVRDKGGVVEQ